jgi:hypothetical protein
MLLVVLVVLLQAFKLQQSDPLHFHKQVKANIIIKAIASNNTTLSLNNERDNILSSSFFNNIDDGMLVGYSVGDVGCNMLGIEVGLEVGVEVGRNVGIELGIEVLGIEVGIVLGTTEGTFVGIQVGMEVGYDVLGIELGIEELGIEVGADEGIEVGCEVGAAVNIPGV